MKQYIILAMAIATLTACEPGELRPIPLGFPGESGSSAPAHPARVEPIAPGAHTMLRDPDAQVGQGDEYIWAYDDNDARTKCENFARRKGGQYSHIDSGSNWKN